MKQMKKTRNVKQTENPTAIGTLFFERDAKESETKFKVWQISHI